MACVKAISQSERGTPSGKLEWAVYRQHNRTAPRHSPVGHLTAHVSVRQTSGLEMSVGRKVIVC